MTDTKKARGRPRSFDKDAGLAIAQSLFNAHGYQEVSVADLCAALGVKPPSLYAAYGSKRELFEQVMTRYLAGFYDDLSPVFAAAASPEALRRTVLSTSIKRYCADGYGCLVLSNLNNIEDPDLRAILAGVTEDSRTAMQERLEQLGCPAQEAQTQVMAISVAMMGYSAAARSGVPQAELLRTLEV